MKYYIKIIISIIILAPTITKAWNDCPYKEVNDYYPGDCGIYTDADGDNICDHSELSPEDRNIEPINAINKTTEQKPTKDNENKKNYHFLTITGILLLMYFTTLFFIKKTLIHKRIWNILLLLSFLGSGILGVLLIMEMDFSLIITLPFDILFWHVELGIVMFVISIFHIIEHWYFYKKVIKKLLY